MIRPNCAILLALAGAFFAVPVCVADVTFISASESVSADGEAWACFGFCNQIFRDSFSFGDSQTSPCIISINQDKQLLLTRSAEPLRLRASSSRAYL